MPSGVKRAVPLTEEEKREARIKKYHERKASETPEEAELRRERQRQYNQRFWKANHEKCIVSQHKWREENPEKWKVAKLKSELRNMSYDEALALVQAVFQEKKNIVLE